MSEYIHTDHRKCSFIDVDGNICQIFTHFTMPFDYKDEILLVVQAERTRQNQRTKYIIVPGFIKEGSYESSRKNSEGRMITVTEVSEVPKKLQPEISKILGEQEGLEGKINFW